MKLILVNEGDGVWRPVKDFNPEGYVLVRSKDGIEFTCEWWEKKGGG